MCTEYKNCVYIEGETQVKKNPIAWDKFLYSFCALDNTTYDFVMVFEDDVFIPSIKTITNFYEKYKKFDLITANNFKKEDAIMDWHWRSVIGKISAPYYYSMVCGMGLSRKMLNVIKEYVEFNKGDVTDPTSLGG